MILQLLGQLQFALRLFRPAEFPVSLAEQMVGNGIVGIHRQGPLQRAHRQRGLAFLLQDFPPRRISANACRRPPACNTLQHLRDSAPIPSETAQWLRAGAIYRDKSPPAANAPAGAWDPVPPLFSRIPRRPAQNPVAAASAP